MLEWMHDDSVVRNLKSDFKSKTLDDCKQFIIDANTLQDQVHLAIVDDDDIYMGTVSLKNIRNHTAEFAITVRSCAMGKGYSKFGMTEIIKKAFTEYQLNEVYWCVDPQNIRAVRFYDKNGYSKCSAPLNVTGYSNFELEYFLWYSVQNTRYL